jgi:iron complex transport system substrate-binding protein
MSIRNIALAALAGTVFLLPVASLADPFTVTDVAGREVAFDGPVERVILGEGRLIYTLAAIETENPFEHVVAWRNDLNTTDLTGYNAYLAAFPAAADIPFLGNLTDGTLQTETVVDLDPDVLILTIGSKKAADEVKLEEMLDQVGVKLVYVDFREHIIENTEPSLRVLGQLFDKSDRAQEIIDFWDEQTARVTDVLAKENPEKPLVFMYRAAGLGDCCGTFGNDNYGKMVELAGGINLGTEFLPGYTGTINPEQVIASDPEIIVVTGSDWTNSPSPSADGPSYVNVGPNAAASIGDSRAALAALMEQPAFTGARAVENGKVYAIWHQFYASPYQFAPIQQLAKWFHPDLFADLDPDATFREFHERFLPVPYAPGYWLALNEE